MPRTLCLLHFRLVLVAIFLFGTSFLAVSVHGLQQDALKDQTIRRSTSHLAGSSNRIPKPRTTFAGLWRIDRHFEATIHLKNSLITGPLTVMPALIMADGTEYPLSVVELSTAGTADVSINRAIEAAPAFLKSHLSQYGSAVVRYQSITKAPLDGYIEIREPLQSLSFVNSFQTNDASSRSAGNTQLHGLWWKHDPGITGFFSLSNITESPVQVKVQVIGSEGTATPTHNFSIPAHNTRLLSLDDFVRGLPEAEKNQGGIEIGYEGMRGSIMVAGGLESPDEGFSAPILFLAQPEKVEQAAGFTLASIDMMVGKPDPMMQFPARTVFRPFAALRNAAKTSIQVSTTLYYLPRMDSAQTKPIPLAALNLKPQQAIQLDLAKQLAALNLDRYNGSINLVFSYRGGSTDLLVDTASVDQTGSFVFDINPQETGESGAKQICSWRVANNDDTMISLWNPTSLTQEISVRLYFEGGTGQYVVPVHLEPQDLVMLTLSEILLQNKADAEGNILPPNLHMGSAVISNARNQFDPINVVLSGGIFNVRKATCNQLCLSCIGLDDLQISPSPASCYVGSTYQMSSVAHFKNGTQKTETTAGTWTSSNTSIATVGSTTGLVSGVAAGQDTIEECVVEPDSEQDCVNQGGRGCHDVTVCTIVQENVIPVISGPNTVWWFGGQTPSGYATTITLTSSGGAGTTWSVPAGGNQVSLSSTSGASITVTSSGNAFSSTAGDVKITAVANNQPSDPFPITTRTPTLLQTPPITDSTSCDSSNGYSTLIEYTVLDNLNQPLPSSVEYNEKFTTSWNVDSAGTNWPQIFGNPPPTFPGSTGTQSILSDLITGPNLSSSPNPVPTCSGGGPEIININQEWRIGSDTSGLGRRVAQDNFERFLDHADHNPINTPDP